MITILKSLKELPWGWFHQAWCSDDNAAHKVPDVLYGFYYPANHILYYCKAAK